MGRMSIPLSRNTPGRTFHERKAIRRNYFERFVKGWKLRMCISCAGSGRYDVWNSPPCSACEGTGKVRYKESC